MNAVPRRWTDRLLSGDPALSRAGAATLLSFHVAGCAAGYALAGPLRGAVLVLLLVGVMFGLILLPPRRAVQAGVGALALFGGVMALMAWRQPAVYRPVVELVHFLVLGTTLAAVVLLSLRLGRMRERLQVLQRALDLALARNREIATRDDDTGLINRRHMAELLEQERQRCVRSGRSFCVALLCVDGLRAVAAGEGEEAATAGLRQVAHALQAAVRLSDLVARWDGEQFALLLSDTRLSLARGSIERLRERVGTLTHGRLRLSVGLVEHLAGESVEQMLGRAQRVLHEVRQGAA